MHFGCFAFFFIVSNPTSKVELHWMEETNEEFSENIELMYPIKPLKFELLNPLPYKTIEVWPDGKLSLLFLKD